jgi:HEPN domain-containing protein
LKKSPNHDESIFFVSLNQNNRMESKIKYWIDLSDYDFETAEAMLQSKRYLYVGFMCHQTIEKAFKAYFTKVKSETAPYTHSLSFLAKRGDFYESFSEEQKEFIDQVEPLNIEARYPSHKERLMKSLTDAKCIEIIQKTKELQQWIKKKL